MNKKKAAIIAVCILIVAIIGVIFIGEQRKNKSNKESYNFEVVKVESNKEEEKAPKEEEKKDEVKISLVENTKGIPVLYYHSIGDDGNGDELVVPTDKFKEQMKYLKDNNYHTLSIDEFYGYVKNGDKVPENAILITFDDGYKNNYENAYPVLKEYGFKATIFVITDMVDKVGLYLTTDQIKELSKNNIDIGSHTVNHENLSSTSRENTKKTLKDSKEFLEKIVGKPVTSIAYPFGVYDAATINSVKEAGYTIGFSTDMGWAKGKTDEYKVKRVYVNATKDMDVFKERLSNPNYK
ncbi:Peptidoglycan/xylan/chitin deacetylase, PgdA/CDA1 family [Clostridium cadaveris]|uniref:Peptidoglycan/xylan/chitin deacetylase, PgdA/CDA1 family n=1 Tax=Clostridium cadaveris TaxID=1529 RepID=A0A1I2PFN1_9CLOT|nr:polysaccharide deacetylase family protein [Clostridium cadaveris]MDM8311722.1 polysaccharide deacetylase family protein [Clostridium cadaveris]MDU4953124.1 polysaccharide deacetylase family protein [Clostridium sp.]SFG14962.1 Peptidoglycan/xylan/chitin deacetylase, PgdA/CDA1 family [Clostridium cadaveris]